MNVFLLIFSLICISVATAQDCARKNETYTHIAKPLKTKTPQGCEAKCDKSPPCTSWTWNKKNKKCYLIREFNLAERTSWISGICRAGAGVCHAAPIPDKPHKPCKLVSDFCKRGTSPSFPLESDDDGVCDCQCDED